MNPAPIADLDNDNNDGDDSHWETVSSSDNEDDYKIEDLGSEEDKIKECKFFLKYKNTFNVDEAIFTPVDVDEMKNREQVMMERNDRGYYRCKIKDRELYEQIMHEYSRFITPDMLKQLNHGWSTQKNELMNTSVASYAPKNKHYSGTDSLITVESMLCISF